MELEVIMSEKNHVKAVSESQLGMFSLTEFIYTHT